MIGLRIARIQPPHHWHLDAIQQAFSHGVKKLIIGIGSSDKSHTPDNPFSAQERNHMLSLLLEQNGLLSMTEIYHFPDFANDTQRIQHILHNVPSFTHVISDNPQVTDLFPDRHIIQPENRIHIRASDIRQAIIDQHDHIIQQYLSPEVIDYLQKTDAYERIKKLYQPQ
jgi:nicotinamide-nucleotide adenylyltransferase